MNKLKQLIQQAKNLKLELDNLPGIDQQTASHQQESAPKLEHFVTDPGLYKAVSKLFQDGHHAQAVEAAFKYLDRKVKNLAKDKVDKNATGSGLMTSAFSLKTTVIKLNPLNTQWEIDEQLGYMQIFSGVMTGIRNPRAHEHDWEDTEERALQLLCLANHLIIRLSNSEIVP